MLNSKDIKLLRDDVEVNCRIWLDLCEREGLNVLITNTVRDEEYQLELYAQGRTKSGDIVTNSKVPTFHWDKAGLAFDFCKNVKGHEYDDIEFFEKAAVIAKKMGFSWGGDWKSFIDRPHIQWDDGGKYSDKDIRAKRFPPKMKKYVVVEIKDKEIADIQKILNNNYNFGLDIDGSFGPSSKKAMIKAVQTEINKTYKKRLVVDGSWGPLSKEACPDIKSVTKNGLAMLIQCCLVIKGYDVDIDSSYGPATASAVKDFQKKNGLKVDGVAGMNTITKLLA